MRRPLTIIAAALVLAGCSKREADETSAPRDTDGPTAVVEKDPLIPRQPHPAATELLRLEATGLTPDKVEGLATAADSFMATNVPDFAIKDSGRPWLDRQYVPEVLKVRKTAAGVLTGDLRMRVLRWDEGRALEPETFILHLVWEGGKWQLRDAPDRYRRDLEDARRTLKNDWQSGERQLP